MNDYNNPNGGYFKVKQDITPNPPPKSSKPVVIVIIILIWGKYQGCRYKKLQM